MPTAALSVPGKTASAAAGPAARSGAGPDAGPDVVRLAIAAMGARFELVLLTSDPRCATAVGELALEEIRQAHDRLSAFAPASLISAINRRAGPRGEPTTVDPATFDLLTLAAEVHHASGGAFDITLGPLMRALGFRAEAPDLDRARQARAICGMGLLTLDPLSRRAALAAAGAQLDLGAIAKGHALDLAGAVLREHGIDCALLHAGTSTALALGAPPGQDGWKIALADRGRRLGPVVTLRNQALSVSSPSGRVVKVDGAARAHVLDPRTGAPATGSPFAAAVFPAIGGSAPPASPPSPRTPPTHPLTSWGCARADAWSTALLVCAARPEGAPAELTSLILPAPAPGETPSASDRQWLLEGPAASAFALHGDRATGPGGDHQEILA